MRNDEDHYIQTIVCVHEDKFLPSAHIQNIPVSQVVFALLRLRYDCHLGIPTTENYL